MKALSEAAPTPARRYRRALAFALDVILILLLQMLVITRWIQPVFFADETATIIAELENADMASIQAIAENPDYEEMNAAISLFMIFSLWAYFFLSERLSRGSSLGKRVFGLYTISLRDAGALSIGQSLLRSGMKAICLFGLFPVLLVNYFIFLFTAHKQAGHDLLFKTLVCGPEEKE